MRTYTARGLSLLESLIAIALTTAFLSLVGEVLQGASQLTGCSAQATQASNRASRALAVLSDELRNGSAGSVTLEESRVSFRTVIGYSSSDSEGGIVDEALGVVFGQEEPGGVGVVLGPRVEYQFDAVSETLVRRSYDSTDSLLNEVVVAAGVSQLEFTRVSDRTIRVGVTPRTCSRHDHEGQVRARLITLTLRNS